MPVVARLMADLVERYGEERGRQVYFAMEGEGKGPFGPNGKYHALHQAFAGKHGLQAIEAPGKRKAPPKRGPRG